MNENKYDIVIVGAGLAGLSAAHAIRKQCDVKMAIFEGTSIGSNNPSPLTFTKALDKYDLADCIKGKLSSFAFHNYQGSMIKYSFKGLPLSILDYKKACIKLFSTIREHRGQTDYINRYATGFFRKNEGIVLELQNHERLVAHIMLDCSGKSKFTGALPGNHNSISYYSHVYGAVFSGAGHIDPELGFFLLPSKEFGSGGGWYYPLAEGKASFGYATVSNSPTMDFGQLERNFKKAVESFEPYSSYLKNATIDTIERGTIPLTYVKNFVQDRIIVVGDSAGMATNWTCMGVESALDYGTLAGELSIKATITGDYTILKEFQNMWEKTNKATYDNVAEMASTFWSPDYYQWEWIIKNDLDFLSPAQILERMRSNSHQIKKHQVIRRALLYKIKSVLNKNVTKPQSIIRQTIL